MATVTYRREKQLAYNVAHGITPQSVKRGVQASLHSYDGTGERAEPAVAENVDDVAAVIAELEEHVGPNTIIASNTSALPLTKVAEKSKRPANIVGMHYFSPVPKMPLLEVIVHPKTSKEAAALAVDVGIAQGKTVIVEK